MSPTLSPQLDNKLPEGINPTVSVCLCPSTRLTSCHMNTQELFHKWVKHFDQRQATWESCLGSCTNHFGGLLIYV